MITSNDTSETAAADGAACTLTRESAMELLRPIVDPDIGISIVDLGLIYDVRQHDGHVDVEMTFTTPACPYGPQLVAEVEYMLRATEGVKGVNVEVVWEPAWSLERIDEGVRLEMGLDI
jgi:metal-sulfur cluster biosynthetic enzyme